MSDQIDIINKGRLRTHKAIVRVKNLSLEHKMGAYIATCEAAAILAIDLFGKEHAPAMISQEVNEALIELQ